MDRAGGRQPPDRGDLLSESSIPEEPRAEGITRREALKRLGTSGMVLGAGIVGGAVAGGRTAAAESGGSDEHGYGAPEAGRLSHEVVGPAAGPYGGPYSPPEWMEGNELDSVTFVPPASEQGVQDIEIEVVERSLDIARGLTMQAWTYNGTVPGPTIRAVEGDLIRIRFVNSTGHDHNLHFHGKHSPIHDGWEPVPPGGETVYEIEAGPAGVHPYHCHTMPIDMHISKGLYGALIVDPPGGRPDAHEVMLMLSGWDPNEVGRNEFYTWNGVAGFYEKFPIKLPAGERVRAYVLNAVEFEPMVSFHLHAEMFEVYPAGIEDVPAFTTDVVSFGQMDRAILEFTLSERGRYMFHPHQHSMMSRGAMGWFSAI